jgi:hypothetical protein
MALSKKKKNAVFSAALGGIGDNYKGNLSSVWGAIDKMDREKGGGGPETQDPLPPVPPVEPPSEDPASLRPASNNWPDIVKFYFPKGAGTQYKEGGLVRGGGAAQRGRGRGRIV